MTSARTAIPPSSYAWGIGLPLLAAIIFGLLLWVAVKQEQAKAVWQAAHCRQTGWTMTSTMKGACVPQRVLTCDDGTEKVVP